MIEKLLQQVFPTACGMCGKLYKESICNKCKVKIDREIICKIQYKYLGNEFVKYIYLFKYKEDLNTQIEKYYRA